MRNRWTVVAIGFLMVLISGPHFLVAASDFPTRYIEIIIPYAPGGGTDVINRCYKDKVEKILGQPLVYTYKPGATGVVGNLYVKGSKADGYTLLVASNSTLVLPLLTKRGQGANYTLDDFTPICTFSYSPQIFCVKVDSPYKTMQDFVQAAKSKKMKYGTVGVFGAAHIMFEAFGREAGFQAIHMPFSSGSAAAMTAVLGGHIDISLCGPTGIEAQLRILAVSDDIRAEFYPEVPTLKELGYPISKEPNYYSLWAPKATPREIVDKIYGAYKKALEENKSEITNRAKGVSHIPCTLSPEELLKVYRSTSDFFKKEIEKMGGSAK